MATACNLCHTSSDNRNPYIGFSDGTADNPGLGCVGCHGRVEDEGHDSISAGRGAGLRQHHTNAGVSSCSLCHSDANPANYTPVGEHVFPPYYGTNDTNADEPCNPVRQAGINENWTAGDFIGLDNDGDGLYDTADPDCPVNQPPVSDPNGPYSGTAGIPVQFDGSGSNDTDGTIVAYEWDYGDGSTGAGVNPSHVYGSAGTYTVALTVTDNDGGSDTATSTATIAEVPQPQPPVADPNGPYTGTVGAPVQFDGSGSNDPDGSIVAYDWDFGDGNTATGVNPVNFYGSAGTYTVSLTVTDTDGLTDTATTTATIADVPQPLPPVADPNGPYVGTAGTPVQFDGSGSNDPDGSIVAYEWDFGDGGTGAGVNPSHVYGSAGNYTVALTVTDTDGLSDTATSTATIADVPQPQPPIADPNGPYTGTVGAPVQFDGSGSNDPDGTIVSYLWDFSDGTTETGVSPTHTYSSAGTYTVSLTVTDNNGLIDTATTTATIEPQIEADVYVDKLQAPKSVKLGTQTATKGLTAVAEADTKAQEATVALSWEVPADLVNISVSPTSITSSVTPGKGGDRFGFNADISCIQPGSGTITWTATIDATENRVMTNDAVTATTDVTCR